MSVTANIIVNIRVELEQVFNVCYLKKKKKVMIPADEKSKSPTTLTLIYVDRYSLTCLLDNCELPQLQKNMSQDFTYLFVSFFHQMIYI